MKPTFDLRAALAVRLRHAAVLLASAALVGWIGCASHRDEPLGVARIAITNVPADGSVACIRITAAGDVTVETLIDVTPGESSVFSLDRLPVGSVAFTGDAFPSICAVVLGGTVPTWVSDPVVASVNTVSPVTVSLMMHRNGQANVGVDFDDAGPANGVPCLTGAECCAGQCAGGACCTPLGNPCAANSDCCMGVCNLGVCQSLLGCHPNGAACAADADCCGGNSCVDAVCCSSPCGGGAAGDCQACSVAKGAAIDGTCGPTTGNACDDGNACTQADTCQAGVCAGLSPIPCAAQDQCHAAGACDPLSGVCSSPALPDGTACDDNDVATQNDACTGGVCVGCKPSGASCAGGAECCGGSCFGGICQPSCQPYGIACGTGADCCGGNCVDGVCCDTACGGGAAGDCQACSVAKGAAIDGTCSPTTGNACDDGDACTQTDTCQSGVCAGSNPVVCVASNSCHSAGVCDPMAGTCSSPALPDNTACNDGNASTVNDVCHGGVCIGNTCLNIVRSAGFTVADTYVHSGNPATNYGSAAELVLGSSTQSLFRFDISAVPAGANLVSAVLQVRTEQANAAAAVNVHNILAPWVEGTVTYASFGNAFAPAILASYTATSGFHSLDLLSLVQAWYAGTTVNNGVLLESSGFNSVYSSETPGGTSQPTLRVCYWM